MNINDIMAGMTPTELAEFNAAGNANPMPQQQYSNSSTSTMYSGNTNTVYGNNNTVVNGNQIHLHVKKETYQHDDYCYSEEEIRQDALAKARMLINQAIPLWQEKGFSSQLEYQEAIMRQRQINSYRLMSVGKFVGKVAISPIVGLAKLLWWTALTINGNNAYQVAQRKQQLLSSTPSTEEVEEIIETTIVEEKDKAEARRILQAPPPKAILDEYQQQSRTAVERTSSSIYALMGGN